MHTKHVIQCTSEGTSMTNEASEMPIASSAPIAAKDVTHELQDDCHLTSE